MYTYDSIRSRLAAVSIPNGSITHMEEIPAAAPALLPGIPGRELQAHCRICFEMRPVSGSLIRSELWLPLDNWNGNYFGTGNGGYAGQIQTMSLATGVRRGYATSNTDMGTSAGPDAGVGNPACWDDFGHRATHLTAVVSKQLTELAYGRPPAHSYFAGGSTGGQQALMEAQRYPEDYDGILCVAPAHNRTHLHLAFLHNWLALNHHPKAYISQEDADRLVARILEAYGGDGQVLPGDRFLQQPDLLHVDPAIFFDILNPAQTEAYRRIQAGTVDPATGRRIYVPLPVPGSEAQGLGLPEQGKKDSFSRDYLYLFRWVLGKEFDFSQFDFHNDTARIDEILAPILNASSPDLRAFRDRGGKLLLVHGMADPIIPYTDSLNYYHEVADKMGGFEAVQSFFRCFAVPGFAHTLGGPGVQDIGGIGIPATPVDPEHDAFCALTRWVEDGVAPVRLLPVGFENGDLRNGFLKDRFAYHRPVYPYPTQAIWQSGDPNEPNCYTIHRYLRP